MLGVVLVNAFLLLATPGDGTGDPRPRGALALAVGEPVTALAAGDEVVVVATERGDVLLLDGAGAVRRRFRIPAPQAPYGRPARADGVANGSGRRFAPAADGFTIGAGISADDDFNDPYDVDSQVEDPTNVLRDDGPSAGRRAGGGWAGADPVVVAASGRTAWVASSNGLLRASLDASTPPGRVGGSSAEGWSALAASSNGRWLAGVRGGWLVRSADAGETLDSLGPVADPVRRLAVTDAGDILVVDASGARRIGAPATGTASAWPDALDLCVSRRGAVILTDGGVVVIEDSAGPSAARGAKQARPGSPSRGSTAAGESAPEPGVLPDDVNRLACDASGGTWVVGGASLWTSFDAGRTWSRQSELPSVAVAALAVASDAAWIASREGLWRVPIDRGPDASRQGRRPPWPERSTREPLAGEGDGPPPPGPRPESSSGAFIDLSLAGRRPPWWAAALPRVDLAFTWATGGGRRDVRAFVLLSFAIERDSRRALIHRRLMSQVLRRRNDLEGAALALSAVNSAASDPIDAEERAALAHVLEVPHE